jgi:uncharacterized membrane protein YuzA (DUF378 family)
MRNTNALELILALLLIIGGINWALVGLFNFNLVDSLFGVGSPISRLVYVLVGISGLYYLIQLFTRRTPESLP